MILGCLTLPAPETGDSCYTGITAIFEFVTAVLVKIQSLWNTTAYLQVNSYYLPRRHVPEDMNPAGITVGIAVSSFFHYTHIRSCRMLPARKSLFVSIAKRLIFVDDCSILDTPGRTRITVVMPEIATFRYKTAYLRYTRKSTH